MRWLRGVLLFLLALGVLAALARAMRPKPHRVEVARATRGRMVVELEADGRTRLHDRYVLSSPLPGQLARIELRAGDEVQAGAVVARVLPTAPPMLDERSRQEAESRASAARDALRQAQSTVERARLAAEYSRREATRQRSLAQHDAVSAQAAEMSELEARSREAELSSATFGSRVAAHQVETAEAVLGRLRNPGAAPTVALELTAPVRGRVLRVVQQSAGVVNAGAPLLELGDPEALEVVVDVLTEEAVRLPPRARVRLERWGGDPLEARVRLVEPSAFTQVSALGVEEQRVHVVADLQGSSEQRRGLGDGYHVTAYLEVWRAEQVLRVPVGTLARTGEQWAVFVVDGAHARRRVVELGQRNATEVQVLRGLEAGAVLVAHPDDAVTDGALVEAL